MIPSRRNALLIINPVAGRKTVQRFVTQIVRDLMDKGYLVTTAVTGAREEAKKIVEDTADQYDLIVCAGGDGTLNECISGLAEFERQIPVGYIPCGSTNDFAATHGLSIDIPAASKAVSSGRQRKFDVGRFNERLFLHHALFGAFTWMAYSTDQEQKNKLGYGAYILDGLRGISKLKPYSLSITANGQTLEGDYLFGSFSTNRFIAGIYELPEILIGDADGKIAAVLIKAPKNVLEWDTLAHSILSGDPNCDMVNILLSDDFRIKSPNGLEWSLDGESSGERTEAHISANNAFLLLQG